MLTITVKISKYSGCAWYFRSACEQKWQREEQFSSRLTWDPMGPQWHWVFILRGPNLLLGHACCGMVMLENCWVYPQQSFITLQFLIVKILLSNFILVFSLQYVCFHVKVQITTNMTFTTYNFVYIKIITIKMTFNSLWWTKNMNHKGNLYCCHCEDKF